LLLSALSVFTLLETATAQTTIEKTVPLSKKASKGYFYDARQNPETGNIEVVYKFKNNSSDEKGAYETYYFDKDLTPLKQEESSVLKSDIADKPDYKRTYVYATVGGCTSFNILSNKLHLTRLSFDYTWNTDKKGYVRKRTDDTEIKPANDEKRAYSGYISFANSETGNLMVLAASETKGEKGKLQKDFVLLDVKTDLSTTEIPLLSESSQLVYSGILQNPSDESGELSVSESEGDISKADMFFIFAPSFNKNSTADYKKYTYIRADKNGKIKANIKFDSPSPNLIITGLVQNADGSFYLCGSYNNLDKTFDQLYQEYSPLPNPCYTEGLNHRMTVYENKTEKLEMNYFSLFKFKDDKVEWSKSTPIEQFEKVLKKPASQKKTVAYKGNRLKIQTIGKMSNGDLIITGQLLGKVMIDKLYHKSYKDVVCFQLSPVGEIKAQYGIKTESSSDDLNTIYEMDQSVIPSADGKYCYLSILETNVSKGYANYFDAVNGVKTYYADYSPSVAKINLSTNTIEQYSLLGEGKYKLKKKKPCLYNEKEKAMYYFGSDGSKNVWVAKYPMQ
jgi:hypothetical protein